MAEGKWPTWLFSYNMDGTQWQISVVAKDADEAKRRLSAAAAWGTLDGELVATVPMWRGGFLVPIVCWWHNLWR